MRRGTAFICMFLGLGCWGGATADQQHSQLSVPSLPLPMRANTARLVVVGDTGTPDVRLFDGIAKVHRKRPIDAILLMGDNFYHCGVKSIDDRRWRYFTGDIGRTGIPVYPILGNHDYGNPRFGGGAPRVDCFGADPGAQVKATGTVANWTFPARSYVLTSKLLDVVMIDTSPLAYGWTRSELGSATSSGAQHSLDLALRRSKAHWKIVAGHHVLFSSGAHGTSSSGEVSNMRKLLPILRSNSVDLYSSGHDHHLELIGAATERPLFLVSGAGAKKRSYRKRPPSEPPTVFPSDGRESFLGFAVIEVNETQMTTTFYDHEGTARSEPLHMTKSARR